MLVKYMFVIQGTETAQVWGSETTPLCTQELDCSRGPFLPTLWCLAVWSAGQLDFHKGCSTAHMIRLGGKVHSCTIRLKMFPL